MRVLLLTCLVAVVAAIATGSLISGSYRLPPAGSSISWHLCSYALLGVLAATANKSWPRGLWSAFALSAALGAGIEIVQLVVPVRTFSFHDMAANVLGAGIGVGVVALAKLILNLGAEAD